MIMPAAIVSESLLESRYINYLYCSPFPLGQVFCQGKKLSWFDMMFLIHLCWLFFLISSLSSSFLQTICLKISPMIFLRISHNVLFLIPYFFLYPVLRNTSWAVPLLCYMRCSLFATKVLKIILNALVIYVITLLSGLWWTSYVYCT